MAIKTLLAVHSADEPIDNIKPTIQWASDIGAHLDLVVFGVMKSIPTATYGGLPDYYLADIHDQAVRDANKRAVAVEALVSQAQLSASILVECVDRGMITRAMSRHALFCDLAVFPHGRIPEHEYGTEAFNGIIFQSGQPVLVLGAGDKPVKPFKRIVMAWNSEPEAARAIHRSLPILAEAEEVHVVLVDPDGSGSGANPGDDMATFLSRHDLKVTVDQIPSAGREVADVLLQSAMDKDADIIVMGAYGHTRFREWLLGGTTRDLLTRTKLPVLLAH